MRSAKTVGACGALLLAVGVANGAAQQVVQLPARDAALTERLAAVYAIGAAEGASWELLSGVRAVAFDREDNLYVLDGQNHRVLVFDARGRFVRQFGKRGGGPGELQAPLGLAVTADGKVAVSDVANRGYIVYERTGEYVRNVTFDDAYGMPIGRLEPEPQGGLLTRASARMPTGGPPTENTTSFLRQPLQERSSATSLFRLELPPPQTVSQGERRMVIMMPAAFAAQPTFGALPDGSIAVHHEQSYAIKLIDPQGRHMHTLTRPFQPRRVTKRDQEAELERRRNARVETSGVAVSVMQDGAGNRNVTVGGPGQARGGANPAAVGFNLDDIPFAETMSVVTNLRTDPQGRLWIQRRKDDGTTQGPIDLVTASGRYIGTLPPQALPDAVSASGLAAYIVRDDLGIERVAVRRLPAGWR